MAEYRKIEGAVPERNVREKKRSYILRGEQLIRKKHTSRGEVSREQKTDGFIARKKRTPSEPCWLNSQCTNQRISLPPQLCSSDSTTIHSYAMKWATFLACGLGLCPSSAFIAPNCAIPKQSRSRGNAARTCFHKEHDTAVSLQQRSPAQQQVLPTTCGVPDLTIPGFRTTGDANGRLC